MTTLVISIEFAAAAAAYPLMHKVRTSPGSAPPPSNSRPGATAEHVDDREHEDGVMTAVAVSAQVSELLEDHPGWVIWPEDSYSQRAFRCGETVWMVTSYRTEASFQPVVEAVPQTTTPIAACPLVVDTFDAATLPPPVRRALLPADTIKLHRVRNPDVWDAMLMPIFRHRVAITTAADRYRAFCARYGTVVTTKLGNTLLPPRSEIAATLDDDVEVVGRRMPFIREVARECLRLNPAQASLSPSALYDAVHQLPGIGKWSAARIVADTTGDFSYHERAGFGSHKHWQQHAVELDTADRDLDPTKLWTSCDYRQRSAIVALTTHHHLSTPGKRESTDRNDLIHLLRDSTIITP